jgi:hypothetical protein
MSYRTAAMLAWGTWALTLLATTLTPFLASLNEPISFFWGIVLISLLIFAFSTVGALVASRRPEARSAGSFSPEPSSGS